jgi:hypothetical protein
VSADIFSETLNASHQAQLEGSAIDPDIASERGYKTITSAVELGELEPSLGKAQRRVPGLVIPIYRLGEPEPYTYLLRPDKPRTRNEKPVKYEWPAGVAPCLDILPRYRDRLTDPTMPILFTEGAKKADAAASLGGYLTVNLNGVYGWRAKGKDGGKAVLVDFEYMHLPGRRVILAFDSDFQLNRQVRRALNRFAAVLQRKGAEVYMLNLPTAQDGNKTGLDDFLAGITEGSRLQRVEELLTPYEGGGGMSKAGTHPVTLEELYHPPGYHMQGETLMFTNSHTEEVSVIYPGNIMVTALGHDLEAKEETATVSFMVRGERRTVTAPRQEFAKARTLIDRLGARGAAVHERNARALAAYLTEFASLNDEALPYTPHTPRLGLVGTGLVTPGGSIGTEARYEGARTLRVGKDADAYPRAIAEALTWQQADGAAADVWPLLLTLGAALASPAIARLQLRRSPVIYLTGPSGSGKTTVGQFGIGAWSDPEGPPFHIETPRTTQAGFLQTLAEAGGLPVLVDEVHAAKDPKLIEATVYQFANGQSYTKGSITGRAAGGEALHGAVILAGEAVVEFINAGAARRVLYLPANLYAPLGCEANTSAGRSRAKTLEDAWKAGAGLLGPRVAEAIWGDWDSFEQVVNELSRDYGSKLSAWAPGIAAISATLEYTFELLEFEVPESVSTLDQHVEKALKAAEDFADPAALAFEAIRNLIGLAKHDSGTVNLNGFANRDGDEMNLNGASSEAHLNGELIAWQRGEFWYVPTGSKPFNERVGSSAVQLFSKTWQAKGLIEPDPNGKATHVAKTLSERASVRVLKVPHDKV